MVVPAVAQPVTARQHRYGRPRPARQVKPAARDFLGERHGAALAREPVQMDDDIYRRRVEQHLVPAQKQIRLGSGMRPQHRRVVQISLACGDDPARHGNRKIRHRFIPTVESGDARLAGSTRQR